MQFSTKKKTFVLSVVSCVPALCIILFVAASCYWNIGFHDSLPFDYYLPAEDTPNLSAATVARLTDNQWTPLSGNRSLNPTTEERELWLRVKVPARDTDDHVTGSINHLFIYGAEFFVDTHTGAPPLHIGASDAPKTWAWPTEPSFRIAYLLQTEQTIFIKINKRAIFGVPFFVQNDHNFSARINARTQILGVLVGCMLGIIIVCCGSFTMLRQRGFLSIAAFQGSAMTALLLYSGEGLRFIPELAYHHKQHILVLDATFLFALIFAHSAFNSDFLGDVRRRYFQIKQVSLVVTALSILILLIIPFSSHTLIDYMIELYFLTIAAFYTKDLFVVARDSSSTMFALAGLFFACATISTCLAWSGLIINSIYLEIFALASTAWVSIIAMGDTARRMNKIRNEHKNVVDSLKTDSKAIDGIGPLTSAKNFDVSIMFIDIVGFTASANAEDPSTIFSLLSDRLLSMIRIIERHGGTIDRSLGDGLLCFFTSKSVHHAISALTAARDIQNDILNDLAAITGKKSSVPIMPVRIGIHSDKVLLANVGGSSRVDFSIIGYGVNLANRLEQACAPFRILISSETHAYLLASGIHADKFDSVQIPLKHKINLMSAFEYDPLRHQRDKLLATLRQRDSQKTDKHRSFRYRICRPHFMQLSNQNYQFDVDDFSFNGFRANSSDFLAQGAIVDLSIDTGDGYINLSLQEKLLRHFKAEVRWSRSSDKGYDHGFKIIGDTPAQSTYRLGILLMHPSMSLVDEIAV